MNANTTITLDQFYAAVTADIKAAFPVFTTVEFDREDRETVPLPACLLEITAFDDDNDNDPGTEQWPCVARLEVRVILPFRHQNVKLECRKLTTALAVWLRKRRFNHPTTAGKKLPTGPAQVISAERDDFDPKLDKFDVWLLEFTQQMQLGATVWTDGNLPPTTVFIGVTPDIGTGNEDKYMQVIPL